MSAPTSLNSNAGVIPTSIDADNNHQHAVNTKKTAKLTQIEKQSDSGRRLVEYFVVVSSVERSTDDEYTNNSNKNKSSSKTPKNDVSLSEWKTENLDYYDEEFVDFRFCPAITARYPLVDHHDNPLHENVTFFCHPSGGIRLRTAPYMPKVHYFVATGGTGKQMYGTCLTLWESYFLTMKDGSEREVYLPKSLVILSTYPYLIAFREYLTQLNHLRQYGEMTLPIERYIVNFCAEIPAPPPGSCEVQTTILDSVIRIWSPPHNLPIAWVSLPFANTFECLDIDNIILVWHCLVLERQVLITSTQLSILTTACEIFLSLLFPMRWSHAYIPVLPTFMIPILSAPMPFLCGIDKTNLADALYDLSRDCVLVDLDKNTVTLGPDTHALPPLPPVQEATLRGLLEDNVGMIFREVRSLTKNDDYSDSGTHLSSEVKMRAEAMWESKLCLLDEAFQLYFTPEEARKCHLNGNDASGLDYSDREMQHPLNLASQQSDSQSRKQSTWDAVQEAFLDTFVYLLRNYRKYLVFPSKHNEGSYGGAGFRSKEFIESQRYDMREFLEQLIGTQMFDNFITKRLYGSGEADVAFFDMAVDRFLKSAGLFADVDLGGRLMSSVKVGDKRTTKSRLARRPTSGNKINDSPLLQTARVHRKLKTIVPPEPTGEGLPDDILYGNDNAATNYDDDDVSVHSTGTAGTSGTHKSQKSSLSSSFRGGILDKTPARKPRTFAYPIFPSEFDEELFGTPRPLSSVVIAEFDRQRKDAAQFRRKGQRRQGGGGGSQKHIQHAHSTVDPIAPPSPEVATFTVFFMAFTAMVGRELIEKAVYGDETGQNKEKTILSTYVPTTRAESDTESETATNDGSEVDEEERQGVARMKTSRPHMGGMFGDSDDDVSGISFNSQMEEIDISDSQTSPPVIDVEKIVRQRRREKRQQKSSTTSSVKSNSSEASKPRERFRDKLSDLEIEEAKATGRAQLGLAFEILTMMKKRGLKADPEAYQCLIDASGRVGDTKRATDLLSKMHEDGIVADGTVYACLVSAFSAESAWKVSTQQEDLPEWANSTAVEMDWNKLQKRSLIDRLIGQHDSEDSDDDNKDENLSSYQKIRKRILNHRKGDSKAISLPKTEDAGMEFFVTESVERQIALGENLLEIVFPDISVDTENEVCPRCNFLLSDDDVVVGWRPEDSQDYTTACPNCTQRFVPHFCVQSSAKSFIGSRGPASPLMCERLSPWVLQKEIRTVMSDIGGINNLVDPEWRGKEYKNAVLWWNLVLSCMRYRLPFSFLLQGSFEQQLIAPMPVDDN